MTNLALYPEFSQKRNPVGWSCWSWGNLQHLRPNPESAKFCHPNEGGRVDVEPGDKDVHLVAVRAVCWVSVECVSCLDCSVWNLIWAPGWAGRRAWKIWHWLISCFTGPATPKVYFLAKTETLQATACNDMQSRGETEIVRGKKKSIKNISFPEIK